MMLIFALVALAGTGYFLLAKRRVDLYSVAFFGSLIYFMPGFTGIVLRPPTIDRPIKLPVAIAPETYVVFIVVLAAILVAAIVADAFQPPGSTSREKQLVIEGEYFAPVLALVISCLGLAYILLNVGPGVISVPKSELMSVLGRGYTMFSTGAALGTVLAFARRQRTLLTVGLVLLTFDLLLGFRFSFAMAGVSIALLWLFDGGRHRFAARYPKAGALLFFLGTFLFLYQNLKEPLKSADFAEVFRRLSTPAWHIANVAESEPFMTQSILNEVLVSGYTTGAESFESAAYQLMFFAPQLGADAPTFNDLVQPSLFSNVPQGIASNIWAQMWSAGGWPLLVIFICSWLLLLHLGNRCLSSHSPAVRGGVALWFVYWAFYMHRNDLSSQLALEKRVLMIWLVTVLLGALMMRLADYANRPRPRGTIIKPAGKP